MASEPKTVDTLIKTYQSHIGDPSTADEARGYWLFAFGSILGILGMLLFLFSPSAGTIRQWSIVFGATGLVLMIAGPVIRLPLQAKATWMVYLGGVISAVAIGWFVMAYPAQWTTQSGNLPIIALYGVGVFVVAAAGTFVPVLSDRGNDESQIATLQAEIETLRESNREAATDEDDQTEEVDNLTETLADSEATVEKLRADLADTEADEAELAVLLGEYRASESQFELYEDRGGSWRWRLRHQDGDVIASSNKGYARQKDAQQAMQTVQRDAHGATVLHIEHEADLPDAESAEGFVIADEGESQATFEFYEDNGSEYRWRLRHNNGNMLAHGGQGYASRSGAEHSVEGIRDYVGPAEYLQPDPTAIEVFRDEANEWRWRLRHKNGNILAGSGEGYENRSGVRKAIDRLRERIGGLDIEVYEDEAGGYRWRLEGGDKLVKADSGHYESRKGAEKAVDRVRTFLPEADLVDIGRAAFEIYVDEGGEHRWRLRHRNGNVLASSGEGYASRGGVWDAIESVKRNAPDAGFTDTEE